MNTLIHIALAAALLYMAVCAGWWVTFWWDATDADQEVSDLARLEALTPATLGYRKQALRRGCYARAQMARFYAAPWLIITGQCRRTPLRHRR